MRFTALLLSLGIWLLSPQGKPENGWVSPLGLKGMGQGKAQVRVCTEEEFVNKWRDFPYCSRDRPVISVGWGSSSSSNMVGAMSARIPPSRRPREIPAATKGTGLVV